jgi:hypothetical protein
MDLARVSENAAWRSYTTHRGTLGGQRRLCDALVRGSDPLWRVAATHADQRAALVGVAARRRADARMDRPVGAAARGFPGAQGSVAGTKSEVVAALVFVALVVFASLRLWRAGTSPHGCRRVRSDGFVTNLLGDHRDGERLADDERTKTRH